MKIPARRKVSSKRLQVKGERTRQTILEAAVDIASVAGLEGLTIGQLATKLSMSKSGLFAHFGSKEELQLATVEAARSVFIREVIQPTFAAERGLARLWQLCDAWFSYVSSKVFRGGCFFAAAAAEFDSRPGPVRDRIAAIMKEWLSILARLVADAQADGQFDPEVDHSSSPLRSMRWSWRRTGRFNSFRTATRSTAPASPLWNGCALRDTARFGVLRQKPGKRQTRNPPRPRHGR